MRRPPSGRKNSRPRRPKTAIVPSRSSARHPLSVRRSYSYQAHPKASLWRCCSRVRPRTGMPSSKASRVLDPEEIKLLMKQGEQLIAAGDVATARTVLQRAADAGDANAAMALGATYDPNVLARLGVVGWALSWRRRGAGTKRPRPSARRMQDAGSTFWQITSVNAPGGPRLSRSMSLCARWTGLGQA
jgi:hypothetical protein